MPEFCHLHCHSQYSLLDGAARIERLVDRAAQMGHPAVAITDHGNLYGVPELYTKARRAGLQPIVGCEFYVTPSGMGDTSDRTRYHQVLLAKNLEGYQNLIALSSQSYTDGYYYKPRIDRETLRRHSAGLVATTCCLQGEVLQTILKKGEAEGRRVFEEYLDIFGDDYYIEVQDHAIPDQRTCNAVLLRWADEYGVTVVATNDVHYVDQADAEAQDVLLCLQTGKDLHDPNRMRFENDQFFLKSADEMRLAFGPSVRDGVFQTEAAVDAALDATREIADKCRLEIPMGELLMPHFPIPPEHAGPDAYLRALSYEGAGRRYPEISEAVRERLDLELGVISAMGYAGYFLIVQDFTTAARDMGVSVGPGRGSAAGSAVAYCLGITNIDPLQYDLLFERFLNPERVSMPDIDIDFDDRGRGKVIDYVVEKYGRESVCQIVTFGTMGSKSVIRDVSRVLGVPLPEADRIAKLIPDGVKVTLEKAKGEVPEFAKLYEHADPQIRKLMHYATVLEGSARHTGVHAAGVIIAPGDVSQYVPVSIQKGKGGAADAVVTQYDGKWVEEFGLLKMDFLGLKTLTILDDALALIQENHGVEIDLDALPLDDPDTYKLFQKGDTVAIFQFESSGMREWMRKLKPTTLDDLIAMNALYRPGPMDLIPTYIDRKHGKEPVEYPHPMLEGILAPTYGIPVYQEQVMQMAQVMGGYSLGGADLLRRCLPGDTLVVRADTGERVRIDAVEPGTPVLSLGPDHRLEAVPVAERIDNGVRPVVEVRTRSGRRVRMTEDHPLLTVGGWRHVCDLAPGDAVAVPASLPVVGDATPPPERVKTLAYLLGDGQTVRAGGTAYARFYNSDPAVLDDFEAAVGALGASTRRYVHETTGVTTVTCAGRGGDRQGINGRGGAANPITDLVREADLAHRAEAKRVPDEVFRYDRPALALFLGTLWTTDGSVEAKRLSYSSSSERLVDDLAHLLLRVGVVTMRRTRQTSRLPNHELLVTDTRDVRRFASVVGPHLCAAKRARLGRLVEDAAGRRRNQSVHNVPAEVGHLVRDAKRASGLSWREAGLRAGRSGSVLSSGLNLKAPNRALSRQRLDRLAVGFSSPELHRLAHGDVLWDPIVSITLAGAERVYDLAVPPYANFVADDVVVHNSMGKKKQSEMDAQRVVFVDGAKEKGVDARKADEVFDMMAKFAGYGFNKSHSAAYSVVAYHTAYLKAHYPAEFMAAVLTTEMADSTKLATALDATRVAGIEILPPCVNRSDAHFTVEHGRVRFGLAAIKGVGHGAIDALVEARETAGGAFDDVFALAKDLDLRTVGKKTLEALAAAGAMDAFEAHRRQLVEAVELAWAYAQKHQADKLAGQSSLFGAADTVGSSFTPAMPHAEPWTKGETLRHERDLMGFYVSGHPLDDFAAEASAFASCQLGNAEDIPHESDQTVLGIVTEVTRRTTKSGRPIAFVTIEDTTGQAEVVLFAQTLERCGHLIEVDSVMMVRGKAETSRGDLKLVAKEVLPMWRVREQLVKAVVLRIDPDVSTEADVDALATLCGEHPGACKVYFEVASRALPRPVRLHARTAVVDLTPEFMKGLNGLFGAQSVVLEGEG